MPVPSKDALAVAAGFRIALDTAQRGGPPGERLGRGTGASLEFEDRRAYGVGDDVRHLDWRAYARTDVPMVQVYREEITPRLELYLDASASMGVDPEKARRALDLVAVLGEVARADGFATRIFVLGNDAREVSREELLGRETTFDGARPLVELLRATRPHTHGRSVRILISDFFLEQGAEAAARELAGRGGRLVFLQVLAAFDRDPPRDAALRLVDAEDGTHQDLVLDPPTLRAYRERLERLLDSVRSATRRTGGLWADCSSDDDLRAVCAGALCRAGVLAPA